MLALTVYVPGAGGNHLKNLLCLSSAYSNSGDLKSEVYENPDPQRPPGEVWCLGGRNLQEIFFDRMQTSSDHAWTLAAHVGEMFQYQAQLSCVTHKKIILITVDTPEDQRLLLGRQQRLGQHLHPYWLEEELVWLYRPEFICRHFDIDHHCMISISLSEYWRSDFVTSDKFQQVKQFLNIDLDSSRADRYHRLWHKANQFGSN
jgi:hypothetical protein